MLMKVLIIKVLMINGIEICKLMLEIRWLIFLKRFKRINRTTFNIWMFQMFISLIQIENHQKKVVILNNQQK